jgi:polyribonucleotide nucleotidyltransferase
LDAILRAQQLAAKLASDTEQFIANGSGGIKRSATNIEDLQSSQKRLIMAHNETPRSVSHSIPDSFVGLIIGKKGEQITRIQQESGCRVQIAPDSGGLPDRPVTLTGTLEQIDQVKAMFQEIIDKAKSGGAGGVVSIGSSQGTTIELSIPGTRAGLIIGKNGETIKQLQEQAGVKMVLIQDTNAPTEQDKPLRISGDPSKVEKARQMVLDLLGSRGASLSISRPTTTFAVPSEKAGLVIGKGGETIKEIMRQSGAHVEIQRQPSPNPAIKIFSISGDQSQIDRAVRLIAERADVPVPAQSNVFNPLSTFTIDQLRNNAYAQQAALAQWTQAATQVQQQTATMPPPVVNPQTGQPDYTAAWVEYYRRQGLHEQADAILRHSQQSNIAQTQIQTLSQPRPAVSLDQWQQLQQLANVSVGGWNPSGMNVNHLGL